MRDFFKSNNPLIKEETLKNQTAQPLDSELVYSGELMTVGGAVNKTFMLFGIMVATSVIGWMFASMFTIVGGAIGAAVVSFIAAKNPSKSPVFAPIFAVCEGLFVGGISAIYAARTGDWIIFQAATLTFSILFTMLFLYKIGVIKVTEKFRSMVMMAVGGIMIVYVIEFALGMFGIDVPFLHDQSMIGIGISLVIVGVASLKLAVDFDDFEKGEKMRTPAYMEWYFGMGLLFTLVWLYSELLYLISAFSGD